MYAGLPERHRVRNPADNSESFSCRTVGRSPGTRIRQMPRRRGPVPQADPASLLVRRDGSGFAGSETRDAIDGPAQPRRELHPPRRRSRPRRILLPVPKRRALPGAGTAAAPGRRIRDRTDDQLQDAPLGKQPALELFLINCLLLIPRRQGVRDRPAGKRPTRQPPPKASPATAPAPPLLVWSGSLPPNLSPAGPGARLRLRRPCRTEPPAGSLAGSSLSGGPAIDVRPQAIDRLRWRV